MPESSKAPLDRLAEALAAFEDYRAQPDPRPEPEQWLAAHADLRDLLEPLLAREGADRDDDGGDDDDGGRYVGDFRLVRELGRGGMGVVYEAEQVSLRRTVALKVLPAHFTLTAGSIARFRAEAAIAARIRHPGVAQVYSVGEAEGTHYFAMELVDGRGLDRIVRDLNGQCGGEPALLGAVDLQQDAGHTLAAQAADLVRRCAEALQAAHDLGLVHRDVKPHNILLDRSGQPRVLDFGLARDLLDGAQVSHSGQLTGTPAYMSPEQAEGRRIDQRSDVFSLGVVLYELLTLRQPFSGRSSHLVLEAIVGRDPLSVRKLNPRVPRDLDTICAKALEKAVADRYQSAGELAEDLRRFLDLEPIQARPPSAASRLVKTVRRNKAGAVALGLLGAMVVGGPLAYGILQSRHIHELEREQRETEHQRDRAGHRLDQAMEVLRDQVHLLKEITAASDVEDVHVRMAGRVVGYYELLAGDRDLHPSFPSDFSGALEAQASILAQQGRREDGLRLVRRAVEQAGDAPTPARANALWTLGALLETVGRRDQTVIDEALAIWRQLGPDVGREVVVDRLTALSWLADSEAQAGRNDSARRALAEGEALRAALPADLAAAPACLHAGYRLYGARVTLAGTSGSVAEYEQALRDEREACERLIAAIGDGHRTRAIEIDLLLDEAVFLRRTRRPDEAIEHLRRAEQLSRELVATMPRWVGYRDQLADVLFGLGGAHFDRGEFADGIRLARETIAVLEEGEGTGYFRLDKLARAYTALVGALASTADGDAAEVERAITKGRDVLRRLMQEQPDAPRHANGLAALQINQSQWLADQRRFAEALQAADEAAATLTGSQVVRDYVPAQLNLVRVHTARCALLAMGLGDPETALADLLAWEPPNARGAMQAAELLAQAHGVLRASDHADAAEAVAVRAADLAERALDGQPALAGRMAASRALGSMRDHAAVAAALARADGMKSAK